jgi:hypothetical protein
MNSIQFNTKKEAVQFNKDWNYYIKNVMTNDDVFNYVKNHKDASYQFMLKDNVKTSDCTPKQLQLINDVLLELFLLSNPTK